MIVSKIIVCPTCGTKIYVRIQKGDYIPSTTNFKFLAHSTVMTA